MGTDVIPAWVKRAQDRKKAQIAAGTTYSQVKDVVRQDTWCVNIVNHFRASFTNETATKFPRQSESDKHRDKKYERWCYWRKQGFNVVTEAILSNGKRPDLIIFDDNEVFIEEVVESEKEESILRKKEDYPFYLKVIKA